jgi:hypothetical protein
MRRRVLLGLGMLAAVGCQPITTDVDVDVILPEEDARLRTADNVNVTLTPDGFSESFSADGSQFSLEIELDPDDTERVLSLFYATGETLLAYGRTPPFSYGAAAASGVAVMVGFPGELATLPLVLDVPDASTLAAYAPGRGMVALGGDGSTIFLDEHTLGVIEASTLAGGPAPEDGGLFGDRFGGVVRLGWNARIVGFRFDISTDTWSELPLVGAEEIGPRPGAAPLLDDEGVLLLLGGIGRETIRIDPVVDPQSTAVGVRGPWVLDAPRAGASATWIDFGDDRGPLLMGGDDIELPRLLWVPTGEAFGPTGDWTGGRCVALRDRTALCGGGARNGSPTADALVVEIPADGPPRFNALPDFLGPPIADPLWLADEVAVYAQGDGQWIRVDRETLQVLPGEPGSALRATGGSAVTFSTRAILLVGGRQLDGDPVQRWQLFMPALPP